MNDKCAGGTGAVIDKINAKLRIPAEQLCEMGYKGVKLHPVAGKCGVFAETDINGLQKMRRAARRTDGFAVRSHRAAESLRADARQYAAPAGAAAGRPEHATSRACANAGRPTSPRSGKSATSRCPRAWTPAYLILVPDNAQYFAAIGSVEFGKDEDEAVGIYSGTEKLEWYINVGRLEEKQKKGGSGLSKTSTNWPTSRSATSTKKFVPATFQPGEVVEGFMGIDGGSTSTKAVLLSKDDERRSW